MDKGYIAMSDLKVGDMVRTLDGRFDRVYSFGHYSPESRAEYLQIHAAGLKKPLELSADHMLFVKGSAVPASSVVVGDKLNLSAEGLGSAEVQMIRTVVRSGAFAPFTMSGTPGCQWCHRFELRVPSGL